MGYNGENIKNWIHTNIILIPGFSTSKERKLEIILNDKTYQPHVIIVQILWSDLGKVPCIALKKC